MAQLFATEIYTTIWTLPLRHIHFTYYDNLFLMDDSLKKLEPCIFDIFIILSFMDYVREDIEKEYEMQASIVNFMKCFLHSKIENLKNNEKIIKKYGIENINESTIYKFYKNSIDDEQEQHIRTLALCSSMFGVFANRIFTFRNKDYTKIKYHPKSILENTEILFPKIIHISKYIFKKYTVINDSIKLSFSIDTSSKEYNFNDSINFIRKMILLYNITEVYNHEHPSLLIDKESW